MQLSCISMHPHAHTKGYTMVLVRVWFILFFMISYSHAQSWAAWDDTEYSWEITSGFHRGWEYEEEGVHTHTSPTFGMVLAFPKHQHAIDIGVVLTGEQESPILPTLSYQGIFGAQPNFGFGLVITIEPHEQEWKPTLGYLLQIKGNRIVPSLGMILTTVHEEKGEKEVSVWKGGYMAQLETHIHPWGVHIAGSVIPQEKDAAVWALHLGVHVAIFSSDEHLGHDHEIDHTGHTH